MDPRILLHNLDQLLVHKCATKLFQISSSHFIISGSKNVKRKFVDLFYLFIVPNVQNTILCSTSKDSWIIRRPLEWENVMDRLCNNNQECSHMHFVKLFATWTQRTAALWPSNLWTGDPTPAEVRLRRSNIRTELSADLKKKKRKVMEHHKSFKH